jgi:hypothetical protein
MPRVAQQQQQVPTSSANTATVLLQSMQQIFPAGSPQLLQSQKQPLLLQMPQNDKMQQVLVQAQLIKSEPHRSPQNQLVYSSPISVTNTRTSNGQNQPLRTIVSSGQGTFLTTGIFLA